MNGSSRSAPGRWRAWARERVERGRRRPLRHRPVGLTLLARDRSATPGAPGARSWFAFTTHLRLSVHPTAGRWVGAPSRAAGPGRPALAVSPLVLRHRSASTEGRSAVTTTPPGASTRASRPISRRAVAPVHIGPARRVESPSVPPPAADRVGVPPRRRADVLVVRLVQGARRVEPPARATAVVHERGAAAAVRASGGGPASRPAEPTAPGARAPHRPGAAEPAAPLDLERLTDRIVDRLDARLVAHRERFGRAF